MSDNNKKGIRFIMGKVINYKSCFDIIGPIMIGPSSSHTAGAIAIGACARQLFGGTPKTIQCVYYESFAKTHKGHGTDFAIMSGILGFAANDERVPKSLEIAAKKSISIQFIERDEPSVVAHANTADLTLLSEQRRIRLIGTSIGGGTVEVKYVEVDGFMMNLLGPLPIILELKKIENISKLEELLIEERIAIRHKQDVTQNGWQLISYELQDLLSPKFQNKIEQLKKEQSIYVFA